MYLKIHKSYRNVVAIADSDLIGKKFEEGILQLDVRENFYKGEELPKEEVIKIIKKESIEDSTFNIVGKESTKTAVESGLISEEDIGEINGIPYALTLL